MVINFDRRPNATTDEKLQSLAESIQLALNEEKSDREASIKKIIERLTALERRG